ncbi:hypothetical protein LTR37_003355 [Vermiconidia calcicola]|uniref:Uncharacterized protein n=1 Tax=Vermiconidia calcicola TaxID=1690605 RepID=A0ACC3NQ29_9PEZI|nr:hypothetical protein LTR37_003355 [Vermiconidia calcicola]
MGSMALVRHPDRNTRNDSNGNESRIEHPLLEICLTSSKGLGLFAKQDIKRGTRILSERPLIVLSSEDIANYSSLKQRLDDLTTVEHALYYDLSDNKELTDDEVRSRIRQVAVESGKFRRRPDGLNIFVQTGTKAHTTFKTNATSMASDRGYSIFPLYSRINHSCRPNVHASYNASLGTHTVHAIRDVQAGEELLVSYIDCAQPTQKRTEDLEKHGVDCWCEVCKRSPAAKQSERRRHLIFDLKRGLSAYDGNHVKGRRTPDRLIPHNPTEAVAAAENLVQLLCEDGLEGMDLAFAYRIASKYSLQLGMVEKAKTYAVEEAEVELHCLGTETGHLKDGNAEAWLKRIRWTAEKDAVKIRMCEKRGMKEAKKAEKKADKKAKKGAR